MTDHKLNNILEQAINIGSAAKKIEMMIRDELKSKCMSTETPQTETDPNSRYSEIRDMCKKLITEKCERKFLIQEVIKKYTSGSIADITIDKIDDLKAEIYNVCQDKTVMA